MNNINDFTNCVNEASRGEIHAEEFPYTTVAIASLTIKSGFLFLSSSRPTALGRQRSSLSLAHDTSEKREG